MRRGAATPHYCIMIDRRSAVREGTSSLEATAARTTRLQDRVQLLAAYGAFVLIAIIVFGTLSHRPF